MATAKLSSDFNAIAPEAATMTGTSPRLQRKCACEGSGAACSRCTAGGVPPVVVDVLRSSGQPLDLSTRQSLEPKFGHDFSDVRVHTDGPAAESARAVGAHAYTVGNRIAFDAGQFSPGRPCGDRLLAHELSHVVQQRSTSGALEASEDRIEREANGVANAIQDEGPIPAIGIRTATRLSRDPNDESEEEKKRKLREDEIDRSFLGLGHDDQKVPPTAQNVTPPVGGPAAAPDAVAVPDPTLSTHKDSTEAFKVLVAQRGFDYVGDLNKSLHDDWQEHTSLGQTRATLQPGPERDAVDRQLRDLEARVTRNRKKLRLVSTPQLKDPGELSNERDALRKRLEGKLTPKQEERTRSKMAALDQQIEAVNHARANPNDAAPLSAYEGTPLGSAKLHTYVTVQVRTADGSVRTFQARNVPGGDHAEDVIMKQMLASGLGENETLKGAKMTVFGDQEVCARCQKRLPEFAEKYGVLHIEGHTTHAPALKQDPSQAEAKTVKAKSTIVNTTNPADVEKREVGQRETGAIVDGEPVKLTQKKTFEWRHPDAPQNDDNAAAQLKVQAHPGSTADEHAKAAAGLAVAGAQPSKKPVPTAGVNPSHPPKSAGPQVSGKAVTALNKADTALSAVRDFQTYKKEYLGKGMSEAEANTKAALRAGVTLGANLKGGPLASVIQGANAFDNAVQSGHGKDDAVATAIGSVAGGLIGNKVAPGGTVGAAVQLINTGAQVVGAPQAVQDATYGAAELVPANIVNTTITTGARSWVTLGKAAATGDAKGIDKLGDEMASGNAGPWIQGYAQMTGIAADVASGDDFSKALDKAAKKGKGEWADRTGSGIADAAFDLGQNKEAIAGKYGSVVGGAAVALNLAAGLARGEDLSAAHARMQKDYLEGKKDLDAKAAADRQRMKAAVSATVDKAKKEAGALVDRSTTAVTSTVSEVKDDVNKKLDNLSTGVKTMVDKATASAAHRVEAGEAFVKDKASSASEWARSRVRNLWRK